MSADSETLLTDSTTLDDWLLRIEQVHPVKWDLGLDRISRVARHMDLLQPADQIVLVAGTNGKGSACEYLEHLSINAGLRTGKSTSPHFHRFNERITLDGKAASDSSIIDAFSAIDEARGSITLTYFEYATLASLFLFKAARVELAILEIGLGGRLDAMNIVMPDVSLITSIALDHQAWLGDSRAQIAVEKAGIMRPCVPCVIADPEPPGSLMRISETLGTPVRLINRDFLCEKLCEKLCDKPGEKPSKNHSEKSDESLLVRWTASGSDPVTSHRSVNNLPSLQLPKDSFAAAVQVAADLGLVLSDQEIRQAGARACLPGRRQWLEGKCRILLDVAHNPAAAAALADYVAEQRPPGRIHAVVGIYADKDISGVLLALSALVDTWHFCDLGEARAESATKIAQIFAAGSHARLSTYVSIKAALSRVLGQVEADDLLLIFGSFPIVAGAQQLLGRAGS